MANFRGHIIVGFIGGAVGTLLFSKLGSAVPSVSLLILMFLAIIVGSILPDMDEVKSYSSKIAYGAFSIFLVAVLLEANCKNSVSRYIFTFLKKKPTWEVELFLLGAAVIGLLILLNVYLPKLFSKFTYHRGLVHSVPTGILLGLLCKRFLILLKYTDQNATYLSEALFFGFFLHLLLDEVCSIDLKSFKVKSSFGTAMVFFSRKNLLGYIFLYTLIFLLYLF